MVLVKRRWSFFDENSYRVLSVNYFLKEAPSKIFDSDLNTPLQSLFLTIIQQELQIFMAIIFKKNLFIYIPVNIYLFKFINRNARKRCEIYSKLTVKTSERRRRSGVFIANFYHISHLCFYCYFEQVNVCCNSSEQI